jgi:hypothetical protein
MAVGGSQASRLHVACHACEEGPWSWREVRHAATVGLPRSPRRWLTGSTSKHRGGEVVSHWKGVAPASTTRTTVAQESCIAIECNTLTALKMLHWLAGAKQPDGSGREAPSDNTLAFFN